MKVSNKPHPGKARAVELKRDLGLSSAVAIVVGTVIGSGIFLVPQSMIRRVGSPEMVYVLTHSFPTRRSSDPKWCS